MAEPWSPLQRFKEMISGVFSTVSVGKEKMYINYLQERVTFKLEGEQKILHNFKPEPSMQDQNLGVVARFARSIPLFQRKKAYPSGLSLGWGQFKKRPLGSFKNLPPNYPLV